MHWCWVMCVEKEELGEYWRNCGSVMFVIACLNCHVMLLLVVNLLSYYVPYVVYSASLGKHPSVLCTSRLQIMNNSDIYYAFGSTASKQRTETLH